MNEVRPPLVADDLGDVPVYLVIRHVMFHSRPPLVGAHSLVRGDANANALLEELFAEANDGESYHAVQVLHPESFPPGPAYGGP